MQKTQCLCGRNLVFANQCEAGKAGSTPASRTISIRDFLRIHTVARPHRRLPVCATPGHPQPPSLRENLIMNSRSSFGAGDGLQSTGCRLPATDTRLVRPMATRSPAYQKTQRRGFTLRRILAVLCRFPPPWQIQKRQRGLPHSTTLSRRSHTPFESTSLLSAASIANWRCAGLLISQP